METVVVMRDGFSPTIHFTSKTLWASTSSEMTCDQGNKHLDHLIIAYTSGAHCELLIIPPIHITHTGGQAEMNGVRGLAIFALLLGHCCIWQKVLQSLGYAS
jgi:hypothetical protein